MLGVCHACANPLTAHYGLTHGVAIGVLLPHVIRFNAEAVGGLYGDLAHEVGLLNGDHGGGRRGAGPARHGSAARGRDCRRGLSECGVSSRHLSRAGGGGQPAVDRTLQSAAGERNGPASSL